jgi:hypothetical protein
VSTILKDCCDDLMNTVVNGQSKEELMEQCVREKLMQIYERENAEFDEMIDSLFVVITLSSIMTLLNPTISTPFSQLKVH